MPDAATLAVLRDCLMLLVIALALGAAVYAFIRRRSLLPVGDAGRVECQAMSTPEAILAAAVIALFGMSFQQADSGSEAVPLTDAGSAAQMMSLVQGVMVMVFMALLVLVFLRVVRGHDLGDLFGLRHMSWKAALKAAAFAIVPALILTMATSFASQEMLKTVWPDMGPQEAVKMFQGSGSFAVKVMLIIAAVISAPLVEEVIFRGFFYPVFKRYTDAWFAAPVNALLFALVHQHLGSFVPLFVLALTLVVAYEVTGSLLVPIFMHAIFNGLSASLLLLGVESP
jgi:membrane protease YdiL (CAAX protease family)